VRSSIPNDLFPHQPTESVFVPSGGPTSTMWAHQVGVLVAVEVDVLVGVFVVVAVEVFVGVLVVVAVDVLVAVLEGVLVGVFVGVLVGVAERHTEPSQTSSGAQQSVPQVVVPATQTQRRRPAASLGLQIPEQQFPLFTQMSPPARQVAASPSPPPGERMSCTPGTPMPRASAAAENARFTKRRRDCPDAMSRAIWSKRCSSTSRILVGINAGNSPDQQIVARNSSRWGPGRRPPVTVAVA
jgi:hypothetical protein